MDTNSKRVMIAILIAAVAAEACGIQVDLGSTPTAVPTTTSQPPEFYAGFTQNPDIPFLLFDRSGESLAAVGGTDASTMKGIIWTSPDTKSSVAIQTDSNGMPESAVVGDDVFLYSNYTNETVDLTVVHPDGSREVIHAKRQTDVLNQLSAIGNPPFSPISYSFPFSRRSEQVDQLKLIKALATVMGAATCVIATIAPPTLAALLLPCVSTIIGGMIAYGKMLGLHVEFLEQLSENWSAFRCPFAIEDPLNLPACWSTGATILQKLKELADQKIVLVGNGHGQQQGTFSFDTPPAVPSPTVSAPTAPSIVSSLRGTVTQLSNCRYGPGAPYLYKYGLSAGTKMEIVGRDADGNWLQVHGIGGTNLCWIKASQMQFDGDVMGLPDAYPQTMDLPISPFFPQITITGNSNSGGLVSVEWLDHEIRSDLNTEQGIEYIVEVWTCVGGKPNFTPIGIPPDEATSASFQVDSSCGYASHADVIGEDKEGFSPPAIIALP